MFTKLIKGLLIGANIWLTKTTYDRSKYKYIWWINYSLDILIPNQSMIQWSIILIHIHKLWKINLFSTCINIWLHNEWKSSLLLITVLRGLIGIRKADRRWLHLNQKWKIEDLQRRAKAETLQHKRCFLADYTSSPPMLSPCRFGNGGLFLPAVAIEDERLAASLLSRLHPLLRSVPDWSVGCIFPIRSVVG